MPRLPLQFDQGNLNLQGQPRGRVGIPVVGAPQIPLGAAGAVGRSIAGVGGAINEAGQAVLQGEALEIRTRELEQHRDRVQSVLDAESSFQEYAPALDKWTDAYRSQGDPRTMPASLERRGNELIYEFGESLNPEARQRFQNKAKEYLNIQVGKARDFRFKAQQAQAENVILQAIEQAANGITNASDPVERQFHQQQFDSITSDYNTLFLLGPEKVAALKGALRDKVALAEVRNEMVIDPAAKAKELRQAARDGIAEIGGVAVADLAKEAEALRISQLQLAEHEENAREAAENKRDTRRFSDLMGTLYQQIAAGTDVAGIAAWQASFGQRHREDSFKSDDYITGMRISTAFIEAAKKAEHDINLDPSTQAHLIEGIYGPEKTTTPQDVIAAMDVGKIDPKTDGIKFLTDIAEARDRNRYHNVWEFQNGYKMMREAVTGIVGPLDKLLDAQNAASLQRWIEAQNVYIEAGRTLESLGASPEEGKRIVQQHIGEVVNDIISHYAPQFRALQTNQLPKLMYGIEAIFEEQGIDAAKQRLLELKGMAVPEQMKESLLEGVRQPAPRALIGDATYQEMVRNLRRREELGWRGGPPAPPPPEDNRSWLQQFYDKLRGATPKGG